MDLFKEQFFKIALFLLITDLFWLIRVHFVMYIACDCAFYIVLYCHLKSLFCIKNHQDKYSLIIKITHGKYLT